MSEFGKRKMERFALELPAKISFTPGGRGEPSFLNIVTSDVSAGGAYFYTDTPLPVGTRMNVDLILPLDELKKIEGKRASIKLKGAVIRTTEKGMAICFEDKYQISPLVY